MTYPIAAIVAGAVVAVLGVTWAAGLLARGGFPLPPGERRIGCVDGLRGYLAVSVMLHHFILWVQTTRLGGTWSPPSVAFFNQLGAGGVGLFFMTTGLVFYPRVLAGFRASFWPAIYTTRVFRIMPLVMVSVAIVSALAAFRSRALPDGGYPAALVPWITGWAEPPLLGHPDSGRINAYVLWSLWFEWVFYVLVLPAFAILMDVMRHRLPSWTLPIAFIVVTIIARHIAVGFAFTRYLPLFGFGMLAYEIQRTPRLASLFRSRIAAIVGLAALVSAMLFLPDPYGPGMPFFGAFFICVACGNSFGGALSTKGALVLGECSFGIYLLHGIVLSLAFVEGAPLLSGLSAERLPVVLPVLVGAILPITATLYLLVERPAIRAGGRLARAWGGRTAAPRALEADVAP